MEFRRTGFTSGPYSSVPLTRSFGYFQPGRGILLVKNNKSIPNKMNWSPNGAVDTHVSHSGPESCQVSKKNSEYPAKRSWSPNGVVDTHVSHLDPEFVRHRTGRLHKIPCRWATHTWALCRGCGRLAHKRTLFCSDTTHLVEELRS